MDQTETAAWLGAVLALVEIIKRLEKRYLAKKAADTPAQECQFKAKQSENLEAIRTQLNQVDQDGSPRIWAPKRLIREISKHVRMLVSHLEKQDDRLDRIEKLLDRRGKPDV